MTTSREIATLNEQICATFGVDPEDVYSLRLVLEQNHAPTLTVSRYIVDGVNVDRATDRYLITKLETP